MASEFSGTDFSAGVFKFFANIIILKTVKIFNNQILSSQMFELRCLVVIISEKLTCWNKILNKLISVC
jgi:hypothetical protein